MSDTGEERELQSDQIVDKKRFANWFGYFKNAKAQKTTVCVYMSSDGVDQDRKHEQPIEAPEMVAPQRLHMGLRSQESSSTSSSGAQTSIHCVVICCHFPYERRSKRGADINNAGSYLERYDAFLAKNL